MLNGSVGDRLPQFRDTIGTPYRIGREIPAFASGGRHLRGTI
jgi:hypothetical protein